MITISILADRGQGRFAYGQPLSPACPGMAVPQLERGFIISLTSANLLTVCDPLPHGFCLPVAVASIYYITVLIAFARTGNLLGKFTSLPALCGWLCRW